MTIRIGTSEGGGTFHTQGQAIAEVLAKVGSGEAVEVLTTDTASVGNANRLDDGDIEFGCMAANWIGRAMTGSPPFARPVDLRMAAPLNAGPLFFITRADSPVAEVPDLAGRRVAIGLEQSGMVQHVHTIFDVLGLAFDDFEPVYLGFADGAEALVTGAVDAQFQCPIPNRVMTNLSERADVRVLPYAAGQIEHLLDAVPYYRLATMRAGALRGHDTDVDQVGVLNVLVTHARVPDYTVRRVAGAMCRSADALADLNPLFRGLDTLFEPLRAEGPAALEPGGVALHAGALAAYRELGFLT